MSTVRKSSRDSDRAIAVQRTREQHREREVTDAVTNDLGAGSTVTG